MKQNCIAGLAPARRKQLEKPVAEAKRKIAACFVEIGHRSDVCR